MPSEVRETKSAIAAGKSAADQLREVANQIEARPDTLVHMDIHVDPRATHPRLKSVKVIVHISEAEA